MNFRLKVIHTTVASYKSINTHKIFAITVKNISTIVEYLPHLLSNYNIGAWKKD